MAPATPDTSGRKAKKAASIEQPVVIAMAHLNQAETKSGDHQVENVLNPTTEQRDPETSVTPPSITNPGDSPGQAYHTGTQAPPAEHGNNRGGNVAWKVFGGICILLSGVEHLDQLITGCFGGGSEDCFGCI
ncbi:hypothetical protein LTS15_002663 [Exophiala xenobiotica]|nr:hypothetical protein LTS15_002663 [Exophiala xenobiotica]